MQTLYIDVYFLINFSVDFLALYFATLLAKTPTTVVRLLLASAIGAATALLNLFIEVPLLGYITLFLGFVLLVLVSSRKVSLYRRLKLAFCFSVSEMLLGGIVYFMYGFLDRHFAGGLEGVGGGANRSLLILAVLVLISIGVFKSLIAIFSFNAGSRTVEVDLRMNGHRVVAEALVDTGNLARDPLDMRSVMLVGEDIGARLLGDSASCLDSIASIGNDLGRRIRLIPISFGRDRRLLVGFRPDAVYVKTEKGMQEIDIVVAIDKEGGKYGGMDILMPSVAVRDVT